MSLKYIGRINAVERDYIAAKSAFSHTIKTWTSFQPDYKVALGRPLTQSAFEQAYNRLDDTYFIRLTAEFEGILKYHLRTNHPGVRFPGSLANVKIDWLISKVRAGEPGVKIDPDLRDGLNRIRDYRNDLAHKEENAAVVLLGIAAKTYRRFLDMLPEPVR